MHLAHFELASNIMSMHNFAVGCTFVTVLALRRLSQLSFLQAVQDVLEGQLQECHCLAGSAAAQMAFVP